MRVMVVGDDAVAHACLEQLATHADVSAIMEHRNPGIANLTRRAFISDFSNVEMVGAWALKEESDLVFITSEHAIHSGLADVLLEGGLSVVAPTLSAAIIGNNRPYARNLMHTHGLYPHYYVCKSIKEVKNAMREFGYCVLKSIIRTDWRGTKFEDQRAKDALVERDARALLKQHGSVIIEEYVDGEEFTLTAVTDGRRVAMLAPVQVAKHAQEGDVGANTEGMASYSTGKTLPFLSERELFRAKSCLEKAITALHKTGAPYQGIIQGRFMISAKALKLLDLRATFGNPDGINCMRLLKSDFAVILKSIADGALIEPAMHDRASVVKYAVPLWYPEMGKRRKRQELFIHQRLPGPARYYFEDVETKGEKLFLTSNRAVAVCATADTLEAANGSAEIALGGIMGPVRWRTDVGTQQYADMHTKRTEALRSSFRYMQPKIRST